MGRKTDERSSIDALARALPGPVGRNHRVIALLLAYVAAELAKGNDVKLWGIGELALQWRKRSGRNGWCVKLKASAHLVDRVKTSLDGVPPRRKHLSSTARAYLDGRAPAWKHDVGKYGSQDQLRPPDPEGCGNVRSSPGAPSEPLP